MRWRELVGLVLIALALGFTPFAYSASLAFGLLAFVVGITGVMMFFTARPWRSRSVESEIVADGRAQWSQALHDGEHGMGTSLHDGSNGGTAGGSDGGGDGGGH